MHKCHKIDRRVYGNTCIIYLSIYFSTVKLESEDTLLIEKKCLITASLHH